MTYSTFFHAVTSNVEFLGCCGLARRSNLISPVTNFCILTLRKCALFAFLNSPPLWLEVKPDSGNSAHVPAVIMPGPSRRCALQVANHQGKGYTWSGEWWLNVTLHDNGFCFLYTYIYIFAFNHGNLFTKAHIKARTADLNTEGSSRTTESFTEWQRTSIVRQEATQRGQRLFH